MTGPLIAIQFMLLLAFILFLLTLLYIIRKKRKQLLISVPLSVLFLGLVTWAALIYRNNKSVEDQAAKKYLGDYKLNMLDGKNCQHCIVRLTSNYRYDIFKDGKIVGHGKWWLGSAIDIPGMFLQVEDGPKYVIWATDRTIDYIDRENQ